MAKTLAYCILHYGSPYLMTAIASLYPQVDKIVILYTAKPSQGFHTDAACPDTREELYEIARQFPKVEWVEGEWHYEGEHTDAIRAFTEGYDWLIRFDSDEIYQPGSVHRLIQQAQKTDAHIFRLPFLHFWRSFTRVCRDGQMPERLTNLRGGTEFAYLDSENEKNSVLHFGYAQPSRFIDYKMLVQAHRSEWRPEWYGEKWLTNAQEDVHPVVYNFWKTESFDKDKLPSLLKIHPFYNQEVIE